MTVETAAPSIAVLPSATSLTQARRLATFAVLSALAVMAWHAQTAARFGRNWQTAGFVLALVVLLRPFSKAAFFSFALVETAAVLIALPATNTNRLLQLFLFCSVASTGLYQLLRSGFRRLDAGAWLALFQPLLRLQLVIVYWLAAWHKLNFGFFDPQSSCAVLLYDANPFWHLHAGGITLRWLLIVGTIATEATLPLLLSIRRTRNLAVGWGAAFHICLGFGRFYSFSMTMIALLFLFTPERFCDAAVDWWRGRRQSVRTAAAIAFAGLATMLAAATVVKFGAFVAGLPLHAPLLGLNVFWVMSANWAGYWLFLFYVVPLLLFVGLWRRKPDAMAPLTAPFRPIAAIFWILPALMIFDGLNPYLGLKTETAFAMYSNLRTEGGQINHLIWRRPLALADYQRDLVQVVDSSDTSPHSTLPKGLCVPYMELRRRVLHLLRHGRHDLSVTYMRNGKLVYVASAKSDPELSAPPSFLERKLLLFREITTEGCPH